MTLRVIDTSSYQSGLNLTKVDYDAVIVKATEGTSYVNPYCDTHISQAESQSKLNGVYHYARLGDPTEEADYFINNILGYLDGTTLLALDFETNTNVGWARTWLDHVYERTGVRPLIYMSSSTVNAVDWSSVYNDYGLWVAQYRDNVVDENWDMSSAGNLPDVNWNPEAPYLLWQWTSSGRLNGYSGNLDLSIFYGDSNTWLAYSRDQRAPAPAPAPVTAAPSTPAPVDGSIDPASSAPAPVVTPVETDPVETTPVETTPATPVTTPVETTPSHPSQSDGSTPHETAESVPFLEQVALWAQARSKAIAGVISTYLGGLATLLVPNLANAGLGTWIAIVVGVAVTGILGYLVVYFAPRNKNKGEKS